MIRGSGVNRSVYRVVTDPWLVGYVGGACSTLPGDAGPGRREPGFSWGRGAERLGHAAGEPGRPVVPPVGKLVSAGIPTGHRRVSRKARAFLLHAGVDLLARWVARACVLLDEASGIRAALAFDTAVQRGPQVQPGDGIVQGQVFAGRLHDAIQASLARAARLEAIDRLTCRARVAGGGLALAGRTASIRISRRGSLRYTGVRNVAGGRGGPRRVARGVRLARGRGRRCRARRARGARRA